jgi:ornithine cyclodeaminase/alanine dehydrogenase-like protein (mu-crystallin family)
MAPTPNQRQGGDRGAYDGPRTVMLLLSKSDVESVMPNYDALVDLLEEAFMRRKGGAVIMPAKAWLADGQDADSRFFSAMTAFDKLGSWGAVCKWNSGAPSNTRRGLPYILGIVLLSDGETGEPLAALDSTSVTAVRTAAATAVAARHLARADTRTVAIIGCGVQGRTNATALPYVLPNLRTVRAYDVNHETVVRYSEFVASELDLECVACDSSEEAVAEADLIVTAAPIELRQDPLIRPEWLKRRAVVITLDYDSAIDADMVAAARRVFVDDVPQMHHLKSYGHFVEVRRDVHNLADAIAGCLPADDDTDQPTLCMMMGIAAEDLAATRAIYEAAREQGIGVDWSSLA